MWLTEQNRILLKYKGTQIYIMSEKIKSRLLSITFTKHEIGFGF